VRKGSRAGTPCQKLLEAADMLFYGYGLRATGVEAVARGEGPGR
jgi:AcrR family transcriptional regulator